MIYEYQGTSYDIDTEDPTVAKQKILSHLGQSEPTTQPQPQGSVAGTIAPTVTGASYATPTGLGELSKGTMEAGKPLMEAGKSVLGGYVKNPLTAAVDYGAMHIGLPPPYATMHGLEGVYNTYKGVQEAGKNFTNYLGRMPEGARQDFDTVLNSLKSNDAKNFMNELNTKGVDALKSYKLPEYATDAADALSNVKGQIPSAMSKVGQVVGPIAKTAGRIAGPIGMGLNLYDAGQMARQTQLGQRLNQGQGQQAEQTYKGGLGMNYQGPQLQPQEAQNVMQSGNQRDINYFGGEDRLSKLMRMKAAQKVLGPVAPNQ